MFDTTEKFIPATHLLGIRHWVQWRAIGTRPQFEVYTYLGSIPELGMFVFESRLTKHRIPKAFQQLNVNGFRPFVLDFNTISKSEALREM